MSTPTNESTGNRERRIVCILPNGIWQIQGLWLGDVLAAEGFTKLREDKRAAYFKENAVGTPESK